MASLTYEILPFQAPMCQAQGVHNLHLMDDPWKGEGTDQKAFVYMLHGRLDRSIYITSHNTLKLNFLKKNTQDEKVFPYLFQYRKLQANYSGMVCSQKDKSW